MFVVRKLGLPGHEEYALGVIASGGVRVLNPGFAGRLAASVIGAVTAREARELERRERVYRVRRPPLDLRARS